MTQKQFDEIVARAGQPPFGTPSQVKTDLAELISEITRRTAARDDAFEPEPKTEEEIAAEAEAEKEAPHRTSGARKK